MRIDKELDLYKYSTMRTHSVGAMMYTPESLEEFGFTGNLDGKNVNFIKRLS